MEIESIRVLRGANLWSNHTVIDVLLSVGATKLDRLTERIGAFKNVLPTKTYEEVYRASQEAVGNSGNELALLVAKLTAGIQVAIGSQVEVVRIRQTADPARFRVVVEYEEEDVAKQAAQLALRWLTSEQPVGAIETEIQKLRSLLQNVRLGPSTFSIVEAARKRSIPIRRLISDGNLVQLGQGKNQKRIWASETDQTSAIGEAIAQDKNLTKQLLASGGVPVPEGRVVDGADGAWKAAREIGLPVVVKPKGGNQGRGVSVNLREEEEIRQAFAVAAGEGGATIVEKYIAGDDYRFLVVGTRVVAAARRQPPIVVGDGRSSITQLVETANRDPRRGEDHATVLSKLRLDAIGLKVLEEQGLTATSIPELGQTVLLRRNANLSTGGSATDVTDEVAPELAARVVDAVQLVGLDVAGVDVITSRVDQPLEVSGGAIIEINAAPGLRMHLNPSYGKPRPVGEAIVATLFSPGTTGRIPIVAVTGTNGKTTTVRCVAHVLRGLGHSVGMTCTDGIYVNDRRIDTGDCSGPRSARAVLGHPLVDSAVLETARGGILREGLGFDQCDVAVVTNIAKGDHLGLGGIDTEEQLAKVKETIVRAVSPNGFAVLKASDPLVVPMAEHCPGSVIFFDRDSDHPVMAAHRAAKGRTVFVSGGEIVVAVGSRQIPVASVDKLPLTYGGRVGFQLDNLLAATAALWGLNVPLDVIRSRLEDFTSDVATVPGRFNIFETSGRTVISDYGHNSSALLALVEAIRRIPHKHRSIVYTAAGDRRDVDIIEQARIIGTHFDEVFLYEDKCTRDRPDGEVIRLMRSGLRGTMRVKSIHETRGERNAIEHALENLGRSDLLLCQIDQVDQALEWIERKLDELQIRWQARLGTASRLIRAAASDPAQVVFKLQSS
jgi:cyanophycin synthetase